MRPGEPLCGYCESLLWAHCVELKHGQEFCELRERYYTDPSMGSDEVLDRLYQLGTPQQLLEAIQVVNQRVARGDPPVPPQDRIDPGKLAAQRWLEGYRNGRNS
jgi:hypothetical protein